MRFNIRGHLCKNWLHFFLLAAIVFAMNCFPLEADQLTATLTDFSGEVEIKKPGGGWTPASRGMRLAAGDYITTGIESWAELKIPGGANARIDEISQIKIARLLSEEGAVKTILRMRTGEVEAHVERIPGVETDFKVNTPTSTISVRGTQEIISTIDGFGTQVEVLTGKVHVINSAGQDITVTRGDITEVATPDSTPTSPVEHRLDESIVSLPDVGRTIEERKVFRSATVQQMINRFEEEIISSQAFQEIQNASLTIDFVISDH